MRETDAERYQREFDKMMKDTEAIARHADRLRSIESLEQLFDAATTVGINRTKAWKIVERDPEDPKAGISALLDEVERLSKDRKK